MWPVSRIDRARRRPAGFTLIEILVALAVFSVMTLMAYKGLERMNNIKLHLDQEMRFWREMTLVLDRMEADFTQLAPRVWLNAKDEMQPPLLSSSSESAGLLTEFIRLDGAREPIHMAYHWQNKNLDLLIWPQIDVTASQKPKTHLLLKDVDSFEIAFLDANNRWATEKVAELPQSRPRGVRIRIEFADRGVFERVVALP